MMGQIPSSRINPFITSIPSIFQTFSTLTRAIYFILNIVSHAKRFHNAASISFGEAVIRHRAKQPIVASGPFTGERQAALLSHLPPPDNLFSSLLHKPRFCDIYLLLCVAVVGRGQ